MQQNETLEHYTGLELELFARAVHWKRYWSSIVLPYVGRRVIEVGAGLGANTRFLNDGTAASWECLEPDRTMFAGLQAAVADALLPSNVTVQHGTLENRTGEAVDTIVYIDVLEHIADDRGEIGRAADRLESGGHLIVLAPAHQRLYSPFDAAIGHYRRYSRRALYALTDPRLVVVDAVYLDSMGLFLSAANSLVLHSEKPSRQQIVFWDNVVIPLSRIVDRLTRHRAGKTVVVVWRKR